ncbi:MAG: Uma2 family endonuclease [Gemmatimonadota bacterium]|nr:Uma2 family endonuclease [Gemmatimonadota bacterium]
MRMQNAVRQWTVDDVHALPDDGKRYEVIDGELFVTPAPNLRHQRVAGLMYSRLLAYLAVERVGEVIIAPADVIFSPRRAVQPDVFVMPLLASGRAERFIDVGRLLLAIEVLWQSTARADRVAKRKLFREEGVGEYWIVDVDARTIERFTPADDRAEIVTDRLEWHPDGAAQPFVLALEEYFSTALD